MRSEQVNADAFVVVDMGAHEFPGTVCPCADLDGSGGNVTLVDFASFAVCFGGLPTVSPACTCSDLNWDGSINLLD